MDTAKLPPLMEAILDQLMASQPREQGFSAVWLSTLGAGELFVVEECPL